MNDYYFLTQKTRQQVRAILPQFVNSVAEKIMDRRGMYNPSIWNVINEPKGRVLDIGPGNFYSSCNMIKNGCEVTAVEPSPFGISDIQPAQAYGLMKIMYNSLYGEEMPQASVLVSDIEDAQPGKQFERAFYFFPYKGLITEGHNKHERLVDSVLTTLCPQGLFQIITEVENPIVLGNGRLVKHETEWGHMTREHIKHAVHKCEPDLAMFNLNIVEYSN